MEHYSPPYTITDEILALVASISEKLGRISTVHALETKPHLRRNNRIKSIHSSLRIEANSLSLGQVRDVLNGRLVLGEQREIQEVKNAYAAYEKLPEIDPFDLEELKEAAWHYDAVYRGRVRHVPHRRRGRISWRPMHFCSTTGNACSRPDGRSALMDDTEQKNAASLDPFGSVPL